jgi:glycosyltransferase involved in cell wall biosynthesis
VVDIASQPKDGPAPLFSIICVYNRPAVLERFLLPSLRTQDASHELILVDNQEGQFSSAAAALNSGASRARGEFLMFVHQDVAFYDADFLTRAAAMVKGLPEIGAAGVVGAREPRSDAEPWQVNGILIGEYPGSLTYGEALREPTTAQTVDELLLIVPTSAFREQQFDELACASWHMYAVDYCLTALVRKKQVYVLPLLVRHDSRGNMDAAYFRTLRSVIRKHRSHFRRIITSCGTWYTHIPIAPQQFLAKYFLPTKKAIRAVLVWAGLWKKPLPSPYDDL